MTTIMRSALVAWGRFPPPELARVEVDWRGGRRVVTWDDVMRERRERQARILENRRRVERRRACRVWVAYFDQDLFGGWQAFLGDLRGRRGEKWIDRDAGRLIPDLMRAFPLGHAPLGYADLSPGRDAWRRWEAWKVAFARSHTRGTHCGEPRGCAFVWREADGSITPILRSKHEPGRLREP